MKLKHGVFAVLMAAGLAYAGTAVAAKNVMVYKDESCGCCNGYIAYLKAHGIPAVGKNVENVELVKRILRVPEDMESCHTLVIGKYSIEGHVPIAAINRLLAEQPDVHGIALPEMPLGAPGMNGDQEEPFKIYTFSKSGIALFMVQ